MEREQLGVLPVHELDHAHLHAGDGERVHDVDDPEGA